MNVVEEHRTSDGRFSFVVERTGDDFALGFDGFPAHTHGDILAWTSGLSLDQAMRSYIDDLLSGRSIIGIATVAGEIRDVWVTTESKTDKYKPANETIEFRYWDGRPVA